MRFFYIKMKIRAGGGALGQEEGALGQQGAPPCYSSLWETLQHMFWMVNKENSFPIHTLIWRLEVYLS